MDDSSPDAPHRPILILFALRTEARRVIEHLAGAETIRTGSLDVTIGQRGQHTVAVAATGVGPARAREVARALVESLSPAAVIAAGFAGALDPGLEAGDLVLATRILDRTGRIGENVDTIEVAPLPDEVLPEARRGAIACVPKIVATAEEKTALFLETGATAADMESAAVAREAAGIPFHAIRAITDRANEAVEIPETRMIGRRGKPSILRLGLFVALHPRAGSALVRLAERAKLAARALDRAIPLLVDAIPPAP
ncbi:MAG: hypothetical protein JXP34_22740 [Planctomycetes bacterium]|nr:hypothetical protein [Planctomycetota bacterium]